MKQGALVYDERAGRYDVRFGLYEYYGGLYCGQCLDVWIKGRWVPTRIEMGEDWLLVGVCDGDLSGLRVRI